MKGKIYNIVSLVIGLGTLGYMSYKIGLPVIWENILVTGLWFIPVIGSWFIIYILNALAFREIIYEKNQPQTVISFFRILQITISGYAINYITPFVGLGGEPYRVMQLKKRLSANKAASSVLLYYIMHVFSHIAFWIVAIGLMIFLYPTRNILISCFVTFCLFYFLVYWILKKYKRGLLIQTFKALQKLPFIKRKIAAFVEKRKSNLKEIDQHIIELFQKRRATFYTSLFFEFMGRVVGCLELYFIALALRVDIGILDSFIISAGSSLFANLVFFTPMQLGSREGGFVLALRSIGMAASVGIFMSLVTRIRELFWIAVGLLFIPTRPGR
ncbi:MAG TPA: lysylphosphatidylglycerol synthase transmembrane domain-containing protein [Flavisolibacter sp.]|nr:lysylphosphatidylglycerol synthase transmembrane domain-containing protein [Flavisolibacter sp.]